VEAPTVAGHHQDVSEKSSRKIISKYLAAFTSRLDTDIDSQEPSGR
jgi:hypothetical protein